MFLDRLKCEWKKVCCKCHCGNSEAQIYGIVLLVIGLATVGAFLIPSKVWVIILCGVMIFAGYKLFTS